MKSSVCFFVFVSFLLYGNIRILGQSVKDFDGNVYKIININNQNWMTENLKVTHYNNGDPIESTSDTAYVCLEKMPKYQWEYKSSDGLSSGYGRIYTWYTITDSRNVCPVGWHIPTVNDWNLLKKNLGMVDTITYTYVNRLDSGIRDKYIYNYIESKGFSMLSGFRKCKGDYINSVYGTWWGIRPVDFVEASVLSFSPIYWNGQYFNLLNNELPAVSVRCIQN